jgi:hypothetical protein
MNVSQADLVKERERERESGETAGSVNQSYLFAKCEAVGGRSDKTTEFTITVDRFFAPRPGI